MQGERERAEGKRQTASGRRQAAEASGRRLDGGGAVTGFDIRMARIQARGMNVSLTPELEKLVARKVASGRYGSASEVVRDALRLLEERDQMRAARLHEMKREIGLGLRDLERGRRAELDTAAIKQAGRARATAGVPKRTARARSL